MLAGFAGKRSEVHVDGNVLLTRAVVGRIGDGVLTKRCDGAEMPPGKHFVLHIAIVDEDAVSRLTVHRRRDLTHVVLSDEWRVDPLVLGWPDCVRLDEFFHSR